ncbi:copper resistance protein CopC [Microbacterium sp. NPDC089695]|uniref:copper resistance CopC family protein n=1 Tax=Microbacterium sp. NPDC089695 TaxID=3364198 RepID=UPI0037F6E310
MKTTARRRSATPIALAAALLTALFVMIAPLSASAHDALIASSPEADGTVDTLPSVLTLTFSEKLIVGDGATEVVVTDASGASVTEGAATVDGAIVTQPLAAEAPAGAYHVVWKIVSSDGHPTSGEYYFTVATSTIVEQDAQTPTASPTAEETISPSAATPEPTPSATTDDGSAASNWIWLLAIAGVLVIAVGTVVAFALKGRGRGADAEDEADVSPDSEDSTGR